tara:strand:- start:37540 stop:38757 length:1218 start_codon:yes stop_codon:yes gene_type:complete
MGLLKSKRNNFTEEFFEKKIFSPLFSKAVNQTNQKEDLNPNKITDDSYYQHVHLTEFVPSFLTLSLNSEKPILSVFKFNNFKGFMCELSGMATPKEYMVKQLGKSGEKLVMKRLKRLETCFDIRYKMYHGAIDKDECLQLMDEFRSMIEKRFAQRGEKHSSLKNWDFYKNSAYEMILNKKASLFIIYSHEKPIAISLDYLYQNIFESAISSYEIDYAKFGLGNTIIVKKLEWCFDNGYAIFNMRWGDYPYKRFWCNGIFDYKNYVVYNKKSIPNTIRAFLITKLNQLIVYMILNKERFAWIKKIKGFLTNRKTTVVVQDTENDNDHQDYEEIPNYVYVKGNGGTVIDLQDQEYATLRKYVYDFQYVTSKPSNTLVVHKIKEKDDFVFIIETNEKTKQLALRPLAS